MLRSMGVSDRSFMSRYNEKRLSYVTQNRLMRLFCDIICSLKKPQALMDFLKDLLNRQERVMLIRRLLIAEMLVDGRTYKEITKHLRCGNTTVARIERWLHFGRQGFMQAVIVKKTK